MYQCGHMVLYFSGPEVSVLFATEREVEFPMLNRDTVQGKISHTVSCTCPRKTQDWCRTGTEKCYF